MSLLALKTARFIYWIGYNRRPSPFCEDADVVFKSMILFIVGLWLHVHHDHEDRVWFVFLISDSRPGWCDWPVLTMHTSSPGATITAEGPDIQETLERERERGRGNANKPRHFSKTKHSNGNKTLETTAKKQNTLLRRVLY